MSKTTGSPAARARSQARNAARDLGHSPNALASSLTTGRTKLIGLVSNNFHNPLFLELSIGAISALQEAGFRVPQDVGVIGLNDMAIAGWEIINLTTIRQPALPPDGGGRRPPPPERAASETQVHHRVVLQLAGRGAGHGVGVVAMRESGHHQPDAPQIAARHHRAHVADEGIAGVAAVHRADAPRGPGQAQDLLAFLDRHRHGLFAQPDCVAQPVRRPAHRSGHDFAHPFKAFGVQKPLEPHQRAAQHDILQTRHALGATTPGNLGRGIAGGVSEAAVTACPVLGYCARAVAPDQGCAAVKAQARLSRQIGDPTVLRIVPGGQIAGATDLEAVGPALARRALQGQHTVGDLSGKGAAGRPLAAIPSAARPLRMPTSATR